MSIRDLIYKYENKDFSDDGKKIRGLGKSKFKNRMDFWSSGSKDKKTVDSDDLKNDKIDDIPSEEPQSGEMSFRERLATWKQLERINSNGASKERDTKSEVSKGKSKTENELSDNESENSEAKRKRKEEKKRKKKEKKERKAKRKAEKEAKKKLEEKISIGKKSDKGESNDEDKKKKKKDKKAKKDKKDKKKKKDKKRSKSSSD